jgi:catalase
LLSLLLVGSSTLAIAEQGNVAQQTVETLDKLSGGPHAGYRANHAKGVIAGGIFTPSPDAAGISQALHFRRSVGVTVRFSTGTGLPTISDTNPNSRPYGMAIRFALPGGTYTDLVGISINAFPVATPDDFLGLLSAIAESRKSEAKPSPIETFLGAHPAALAFVKTPKPMPASFATQAFYGVNAFEFTNKQSKSVFGRYQIVPVAGEQSLSDEQATQLAPNYLMDELAQRVAIKPAKYKILLQIADKDDVVTDPTIVWPADRKLVELGTLSITRVVAEGKEIENKLAYNPLMLPEGIKPSNDPVLLYRPVVYAVSAGRRQ